MNFFGNDIINLNQQNLISLNDEKEEKEIYEYSYLPTDKFNKINFKSVLEKKYTMEQLVDSMTNE